MKRGEEDTESELSMEPIVGDTSTVDTSMLDGTIEDITTVKLYNGTSQKAW